MTPVSPAQLESFLSEYGWAYEPLGHSAWSTGFQGNSHLFPLAIKLTTTCVSFEVRPFLGLAIDWIHWPELSRDLLELNNKVQLVKVALSEHGEVCLSCQVLSAGFDYDQLQRILGIIGYYADELAPEIQARFESYKRGDRPTLHS